MDERELLRKVTRFSDQGTQLGAQLAQYLENGGGLAWKKLLEAVPDGQVLPVVMTVSPRLAEEMAGREKDNRPRRAERVTAYGADMAAGRWRLTGEAPKIGRDGFLRDGGHRTAAAAESEAAFRTLVVFGVQDEAVLDMDSGLPRTPGDALKYAGMELKNRNAVAAVARRLWAWDQGYVFLSGASVPRQTREELWEYVTAHPEITGRVAEVTSSRMPPGANATLAATALALYAREDAARAGEFYEAWRDGEHLDRTSPVYQLRERMNRNRFTGSYDRRQSAYSVEEKLWLALRAWRGFLRGEKVSRLQLPSQVRTDNFRQFGLPAQAGSLDGE